MIHDAWFTFNGVDSRSMGVIVTKMPETVRAERRVERLEIPGRNGSLHIDEGTYASYDRSMECAVIERRNIDKIAAWLIGAGEMVFSTEPDKLYRVYISNKIDIAQMMRVFQKFVVTMDTQPFKYRVNAETDNISIALTGRVFEKTLTVNNIGTAPSAPRIAITGGNVSVTITNATYGTETLSVRAAQGAVIDCEVQEAYWGVDSLPIAGKFPRFAVGENVVTIAARPIRKIEIDPRWRWL